MSIIPLSICAALAISITCCSNVATQGAAAGHADESCCVPVFNIFFVPEQSGRMIDISEMKHKVKVSVGQKEHELASTSEYFSLKRKILQSRQWHASAISPPPSSMPWCGPSRDILDVRSPVAGMRLEGSAVPDEWKRRIMALTR